MHAIIDSYGIWLFAAAFGVMLLAGFTKGAVGFALPMVTVSGVGSIMSIELAVAAILLPGLVTNIWQSMRNGSAAALGSLRKYWRLNLVLLVMIYLCAQLVTRLPASTLFLILGAGVTVFGTLQLAGWRLTIPDRIKNRAEVVVGLVAGFFGGIAGVWGPPILIYLVGRDTPKAEQVRAQGISFLIGSIVLVVAHLGSGVLDRATLPWSAAMVLPALAGMALGYRVQDRLDQAKFRKVTLAVLVLAGLNLLRRGLTG
ncbi:sulfite exporter TauE/SafE family protein [Oceanomicrobium pacificus]|uniref:Probable membrane transporter protein n=1 Tax=Oceanomicrobium pacificus TaxID=2692916 RepID=A0A6B0THT4_9RHOB|nr:sulfite exporter TauE/SafE family protein [Oceanomicrobium pacificus]MXU63950.1 TSUP family transporter [Oceanomicrobium pacificus]